jgi:integrase
MSKVLTSIAVVNTRPGQARREIADGGCRGLYLVVQPSGHRSWAARYRFRGIPRKLTLGPVLIDAAEPDVAPEIDTPLSLAAARELCTKALRQAKGGTDPAEAKRKQRSETQAAAADTLQAIAEEFLRREGGRLRTVDQRRADLELLYAPLGQLPVEQIKRGQYVRVLDRVADERGPVRSDRVLTALSALLTWHSNRSDFVSPLARGMRRTSIKERARRRVLSDDELRAVWTAAEGFGLFGDYLRFMLLTGTRRNEAAGLRRSELGDVRTWVIPAARYKTKLDTLIPLSAAAQTIIAAQLKLGDCVFTSGARGDRPLGSFERRKAEFDKACGVSGWTLHDVRRTARTLLSRARINSDIAERCLGHALRGVRATYDLYEYEPEKRHAFEALAAMIDRIVHPPAVADLAAARSRRRR